MVAPFPLKDQPMEKTMANRNTLAFNKLDEFKAWLESNGCTLVEPKGFFEVLRWKSDVKGEAMPIVFRKQDAKLHFSCNESAASYVRCWLRHKKQGEGSIVLNSQ